ncbi:tRNA (N(6)-L-threonylcarbamoyladenosine(37)-C(2))-methylthiotransferase MtaB [Anaerolineales bacterium HSG6]|nr:tRNA (N(6)-L-threonylcarbamoyladenosine(37)-C(2))-methylthiotransferase MtaB [Anaerolineales bacterium HSG6]MDM8531359.1 tRNA (N(6)-L-threonylcarbamoyladenosine(37)-C(2))-methylthiotransferase MtaB [Anaerolineales bacterium HSG25]
MRIRVDSIGCRLNISEIEEMARSFTASGHRLVGPGEVADLCVFNTCVVTNMAARKSRKIIRQMRRANPQATLVVTGCYADLSPQDMDAVGADLVVDNQDKDRLPEILAEQNLLHDADPIPADDAASFINPIINSVEGGHTRAFIKVQDGCDNRCTFCIVTVARGAGRSRTLADVVAEVNRLTMLGYQEAVLSGVHLGSYLHDQGQVEGLYQLVKTILADTDLPRLRLSSLEPWDLSPHFFDLWQNERLLPHLHLPLQSGCDATLRRMARRTSQAEFASLLETARAAIPDVGISTDVIVGFPGETEAEFTDSINFVEQMGFSKLHIFRYSRREGTAAAKMRGQVHGKTVQTRSQQMHVLGANLEEQFRQKFVGRTLPVLWEGNEPFGFGLQWSGLTGNYLRVVTQTDDQTNLRNQVTPTQLVDVAPAALHGQIEATDSTGQSDPMVIPLLG